MTRFIDRPATEAIAQAQAEYARIRRRRLRLGAALVCLCLLLELAGACYTLARPLRAADGGMAPTLPLGALALVNTWRYAPARGDLAALTQEDGSVIVRRVIGLPGDQVAIDRETGQVRVNGQPLAEPYVSRLTAGDMDISSPIEVPAGCLFLLGDERLSAADSRQAAFGCPEIADVLGRVWYPK